MNQGHEYPIYAEPPNDRDKVTLYLAIVSFVLVALGYAYLHGNPAEFFQFWTILGASAPLLIFASLNWIMDHVLWKTSLFRWLLGLVRVPLPPNLAGDYSLVVKWHDPHPESGEQSSGASNVTMTVVQSWRKISVVFVFLDPGATAPRADSTSRTAYLECTADPRRVLLEYTYNYRGVSSRPSAKGIRQNRIHGTCHMVFERQDGSSTWRTYGDYYSDDGGTGTIEQKAEQCNAPELANIRF